jgi:hypothetical protein
VRNKAGLYILEKNLLLLLLLLLLLGFDPQIIQSIV